MQINLSGHHVDLTDSMREYVENKMARLERHAANISHIDVVMNVEKLRQMAEGTVRMAGAELFASAESEDMYASIDSLTDKLDRQLSKHKGKVQQRKHDTTNE